MRISEIACEIKGIVKKLVEVYHPKRVVLFGSAVWGGEDVSDIDLFIIKWDVPHFGADRIMEVSRLMGADLPVDYLVYKPEEVERAVSLRDPFVKKILTQGRVLYG